MSEITSFAPGRVEILGNHTDYNGGVVLSAALQIGITANARRLSDQKIQLSSDGIDGVENHCRKAVFARSGRWIDYPLGVATMLTKAGADPGGFAIHFQSTLPHGAGLSSSAALEVATAVALMRLYPFSLPPMDIARLCRQAENECVGVNCGLLDQASSVFGKKDHLVFLDCRNETVDTIPLPEHLGLLIINSGVKHALTGGEYNERREQCFEAARLMSVPALRDASLSQLDSTPMPELVKRRARHVVGENERVFEAVEALKQGTPEALGALMIASHRSSMEYFENSTPELDLLVSLVTKEPGCFGARLSGGGFGGAIVALVENDKAEIIQSKVVKEYNIRSGATATAILSEASDGAIPA
jgi:galactokinase